MAYVDLQEEQAFNCTMKELKSVGGLLPKVVLLAFNCTMKELKSVGGLLPKVVLLAFNCTMKELKYT
jgi:hypothetical protein